MTEEQITQIIIGAVIALASGSGVWAVFRRKLSQFRQVIDDADDMVKDNTVTEAEFQKFWADAMALILPGKAKQAGP